MGQTDNNYVEFFKFSRKLSLFQSDIAKQWIRRTVKDQCRKASVGNQNNFRVGFRVNVFTTAVEVDNEFRVLVKNNYQSSENLGIRNSEVYSRPI